MQSNSENIALVKLSTGQDCIMLETTLNTGCLDMLHLLLSVPRTYVLNI